MDAMTTESESESESEAIRDDIELKELLTKTTKNDYASLSPEDRDKKYGNILRLIARLHHHFGTHSDFLVDKNARLAELGLPEFYVLVDFGDGEDDETRQEKICYSRDNDDGTITNTQYDRNGDVSYETIKKIEDRTGVRTEQEIHDVLEYLQTVIRKDFRQDETRGVMHMKKQQRSVTTATNTSISTNLMVE
jgi:hypothetical protein